jgi:hypothetical protein
VGRPPFAINHATPVWLAAAFMVLAIIAVPLFALHYGTFEMVAASGVPAGWAALAYAESCVTSESSGWPITSMRV